MFSQPQTPHPPMAVVEAPASLAPAGHDGHDGHGKPVIQVRGLDVGFGGPLVLENLDIDVLDGEILGVIGASGTGKSVLLRTIVGLNPRAGGRVDVFGTDTARASEQELHIISQRWGVLFQQGALFSSLNVLQNIQVPMRAYLDLPQPLMDELAMVKLGLVGLPASAAYKFPSELSGGMIKRAGLARALALDPEIVFLDEPTSGLDPISARGFDQLILKLRDTLGVTVFMVTHDLSSIRATCDRIAVLAKGRVLVTGSIETLRHFEDAWVQSYFATEMKL